jgi:thiamine-phosphate diphosphorylase
MIQVREKDLPSHQVANLTERIKPAMQDKTIIIINSYLDAAVSSMANGVHLPQDFMSVEEARSLLPPNMLVGKSVHDLSSAILESQSGADYIILGTIFPTSSKPGMRTGGIPMVKEISNQITSPLLVIGGINGANAGSTISAGADGIAVISSILTSPNPEKAAKTLKTSMVEVWQAEPRQKP